MTGLNLTFPKKTRLTKKREFVAVLRMPQHRIRCGSLEILAKPNGVAESRLGIIVGRAYDRRSTRRNLFKRCVREAFRKKRQTIQGLDILVRAKTNRSRGKMTKEISRAFEELDAAMQKTGEKRIVKPPAPLNLAVRGLLGLIAFYRLLLSPLLGGRCRFHPTCSRYAMDAIIQWGALRGILVAGKRICKCHPFHPGGYDPVPASLRPAG